MLTLVAVVLERGDALVSALACSFVYFLKAYSVSVMHRISAFFESFCQCELQ